MPLLIYFVNSFSTKCLQKLLTILMEILNTAILEKENLSLIKHLKIYT